MSQGTQPQIYITYQIFFTNLKMNSRFMLIFHMARICIVSELRKTSFLNFASSF